MKIEITSYKKLQEYIQYFHKGVYELLIIEGKQGIGKSSVIKQEFKHLDSTTDYLWLEGRTSAAAFYKALYQFVDCPVILDDTDDFLSDRQCVNLLKTLCQTDSTKRVQWLTTRLPHDLPGYFFTSSTVIILTNETKRSNPHLRAIQDRGLHILFKPTKQEIHQYAQKLCSIEVYSFIDRYLQSIEDLTLRLYVQAQNALDAGIPWQHTLVLSWQLDPLTQTYLEIELNYPDKTREEKAVLFMKMTGKQERTYERITQQLHQAHKTRLSTLKSLTLESTDQAVHGTDNQAVHGTDSRNSHNQGGSIDNQAGKTPHKSTNHKQTRERKA